MSLKQRLQAAVKPVLFFSFVVGGGGLFASSAQAAAGLSISEWMYSPAGSAGEFIEFTNFGSTSINLTGWHFDDADRNPASSELLTSLGTIAPGESFILTETAAATFRTQWSLSLSVKVLGGVTNNLGRVDEINLYDATNTLVDRLTYDDANGLGQRTQGKSGRPTGLAAIGANNANAWTLSAVGDVEGSYASVGGDIGSPGKTSFAAAIPEPSAYAAMLGGIGMLALGTRRRR